MALFVTFTQPCAGTPDEGAVIPLSVMVTSLTPSVGGVSARLPGNREHLEHAMSRRAVSRPARERSTTIPYVPAASFVDRRGRRLGLSGAGVPNTVGSPPGAAIFSNACWSFDSTAFFSCALVVPGFSLNIANMWSSTPEFSNVISVQPALGLPFSWYVYSPALTVSVFEPAATALPVDTASVAGTTTSAARAAQIRATPGRRV